MVLVLVGGLKLLGKSEILAARVVVVLTVYEMVSRLVRMQVRLLVKALVASWVRTRERLLPSMDSQVSLQVEVKRKLLATLLALIRLLACVYEHVPFKLGIVKESLLTALVSALELENI